VLQKLDSKSATKVSRQNHYAIKPFPQIRLHFAHANHAHFGSVFDTEWQSNRSCSGSLGSQLESPF
jgi:hypothetical protein